MTALPAGTTEPRRTRGGAGGAVRAATVLPPWHGQKIRVPKRVWGSGHYSPGAIATHAQLTALDQRGRHCRAGVLTLAGYLGVAKRTAERYLAELAEPGPDGRPEMTTVRHTAPGGTGVTAERRMRRVAPGEHFAYVPVTAAKTLRPILFVAYCALAYAEATTTSVTAAELAAILGITERSARRLADELEALGWVTVARRTGRQARNEITVHDRPLYPVPDPVEADTDGGSGPDTDGGSLAIKEDPGLTDGWTSEAGGSVRRRRSTGSYRPAPVDNPPVPATFRTPPARPQTAPDEPRLTPDAWTVLQPVRDLLPGIRPFVLRRAADEISRLLDDGLLPEDLVDQLQARRATTDAEDLTDPGRWLLGVGLAHWPSRCGLTDCLDGFMRHTGAPCKACTDPPATGPRPARGRGHPPPTALQECPGCAAPYRPPLRHPTCRLCHTELPTGT